MKKLLDVQTALHASFDEMLQLVDNVLHKEAYTRQEICEILDIKDEQLQESLLSRNTQDGESFQSLKHTACMFARQQHISAVF